MSGPALYLSLLSRGIGEVHRNGNERVDVYLEPEDYFNFTTSSDKQCPATTEPGYTNLSSHGQNRLSSRDSHNYKVPKTFSTRKGALLLFSEDLAQRYKSSHSTTQEHGSLASGGLQTKSHLKTVEDLANSVLKYGARDYSDDQIYLKFVRFPWGTYGRHIRPGFSARRYLATWSRTWDDAILDNIVRHGYIKENSFYKNSLRRRLVPDDLSRKPQPYKLMKNMLAAPDSLSGYTFYRTPTPVETEKQDKAKFHDTKMENLWNIHIIKTQSGVQKEVLYADLDRHSQEEVIKDLLVKSAVHYALKKQEMYNDSIIRAAGAQQQDGSQVDVEEDKSAIYEFDMGEAVESLLESHDGRFTIGTDLYETEDLVQSSYKESPVRESDISVTSDRSSRQRRASRSSSTHDSEVEPDKVSRERRRRRRTSATSSSSHSSIPVLPPILSSLSPVKDLSRETTQQLSLPSLVQAGNHSQHEQDGRVLTSGADILVVGQSYENNFTGDLEQGTHKENNRPGDLEQGTHSEDKAGDVSVEILGESDKDLINKTSDTQEIDSTKCSMDMSHVTESDIMDLLSEHARRVAETVLNHPSSGTDIEADVKVMIDGVTRSRRTSSNTSSAEEYKTLIRESLATAVDALDEDSVPGGSETSQGAVVSQNVADDQPEGGDNLTMQSMVDLDGALGGVTEHVVIPSGKCDEEGSEKRQATFSTEQVSTMEDGDYLKLSDHENGSLSQETKLTKSGTDQEGAAGEKTVTSVEQRVTVPAARGGRKFPSNVGKRGGESNKKVREPKKNKSNKGGQFKKMETVKLSKKKKHTDGAEEPFVTGMPRDPKLDNGHQATHKEAMVTTKTKKKGKKEKMKKQQQQQQSGAEREPMKSAVEELQEEPVESEVAEGTAHLESPEVSEVQVLSPDLKTEDSEFEFEFVRDQSSPGQQDSPQSPATKEATPPATHDQQEDKKSDTEVEINEEASKVRSISNREARAAMQAAAAARRREEVERRRKMKEEQIRKEREEAERQIMLQKELEEQRKRGEEARKLRKQLQVEAEERERVAAEEAERRQKLEAERERRTKEEYKRKLDEMRKKQHEEELRKHELMLQKLKEEEERRAAEESMLSKMELEERLEYERIKQEQEEERRRKEQEEKLQQAEEARKAFELAQRLAEEMARKKAELASKLHFNRSLHDESSRLGQAHQVNRAFVFSYFELLQWLGLDIPELELTKLAEN